MNVGNVKWFLSDSMCFCSVFSIVCLSLPAVHVKCFVVSGVMPTALSYVLHTSCSVDKAVPVRSIVDELTFPPAVAR